MSPAKVIPLPGQRPKEGWEFLTDWVDQRGWDAHKFAGALLRAATPEERKKFPKTRATLDGNCRRWLDGSVVPDAHRSDPNMTGFYRPIIARAMGTTPERIWPSRRWGNAVSVNASGELSFRRQKAAAKLADQRKQLQDLQEQLRHMQELKNTISALEAELAYIDALLAVPHPRTMREHAL
jgi:hypothetical protein